MRGEEWILDKQVVRWIFCWRSNRYQRRSERGGEYNTTIQYNNSLQVPFFTCVRSYMLLIVCFRFVSFRAFSEVMTVLGSLILHCVLLYSQHSIKSSTKSALPQNEIPCHLLMEYINPPSQTTTTQTATKN